MPQRIKGIVQSGYGVASGKSPNTPYPEGTIKMQLPYFQKLGLDLSSFFLGTLNISISPHSFHILKPTYYFSQVNWYEGIEPENFSFCSIQLIFKNQIYDGWLYYPHPETKPAHFQNNSTMELILPKIEGINYGDEVLIEINDLVSFSNTPPS